MLIQMTFKYQSDRNKELKRERTKENLRSKRSLYMSNWIYYLLWFFILYSFIGWVLGTAAAAVREKKFVDVGFLYGPYCPAYGLGGVVFAVFLPELKNHLFFLFNVFIILIFSCLHFSGQHFYQL